jgi:hypothetical protein
MAQLPIDEIARAVSGPVITALNKISSEKPGSSQPGGSFGALSDDSDYCKLPHTKR